MKKIICLVVILTSFMMTTTASDILTLNNGMVFQGKVTRLKDCAVVFRTDIGSFIIPATDIETLEFEKPSARFMARYLERTSPENCMAGKMDASLYHGKKGGHFFLGFLFGPFAVIGTLLANPNPAKGKRTLMMSENQRLFSDPSYLTCYKRKARGSLIGMEALGWGAAIILIILLGAY